jgi:hypothetical protein
VGDLAYPPRRQERDRHRPSGGREGRGVDQADEPAVLGADTRDDRTSEGRLVLQADLGGFQHPHGALDLEITRVGHVNFDQEVGHGAMVEGRAASRHRGEHRVGT